MTHSNKRLLSLDVFRGATVAAMILVNNPGSWSYTYSPLMHAPWHGATPTDWIFPFFLFIVGVSIAYAIGGAKERGLDRSALIRKILRRSLIIFAIGLFLSAFPKLDFATIRIFGVLQRIALVYAASAILFLYLSPRQLFWTGIAGLLSYWGLMTLVPVPGGNPPSLEAGAGLGAWLDRAVLGVHIWSGSKTWDPEGLLSTLPAIVTAVSGILTGVWLRRDKDQYETVAGMMVVGALMVALGLIWHTVFPINKSLWTSSYVVYTSGIALLSLGAVYWWVDIKGHRRGMTPFIVYGTNALFVFALSGLIGRILIAAKWVDAGGNSISAQGWVWQTLYQPLFDSSYNASLAHAITHVLFLLAIAWVLYSRKIFIKV